MASGFIPAAALFFSSHASHEESFWKSNPREDEQARRRSRPADEKEPAGSFSLIRPGPVGNVGWVLTVIARVLAVPETLVDHVLADVRRLRAEARHAVDHVHHEVEAIEIVQHHHVERRGRRAL